MLKKTVLITAALLAAAVLADGAQPAVPQLTVDEADFQNLSSLYQTSTDRAAVIKAFRQFLKKYPKSRRAADARFITGEARLSRALDLLRQEKISKTGSDAGPTAGANPAAELNSAIKAYGDVSGKYRRSGLEASAVYRAGEAYYNMGDWERAIKEFSRVESDYPESYIVPESLLGLAYSNIALNRCQDAQSILSHLEETYPPYACAPALVFAKGVIELSRKNYPASQKLFSQLDTPQAQFFLGKAYLYEGKAYLAASVFEKFLADWPEPDFREEAEFLAADSFFYARDFEGAIVKYQNFLKKYPGSKLKNAAVFHIGVSRFNKKDYTSARFNFQSIIDKNPHDFFAHYSQYLIAESYLENNQTRDALFAYTKVAANYAASPVAPSNYYKLAWCQYLLGDYLQTIHSLKSFLILYPAHSLAINAYYLMGNANLALKNPVEALENFQNAVNLAPSSRAAAQARVMTNADNVLVMSAGSSSRVAEQARFMILRTEYERANYKNILASYQFVFRHLPPTRSKWRALSLLYVAEAYLALNLIDDARNIYDTVARIYPNDVSSLYAQEGLVWCFALSHDSEGAALAREKLKTIRAAFPEAEALSGADALSVADSYFNSGDFEKAFALYDAFVSDNSSSEYASAALYKAGLSLYRLRYYTQAVETWTKLAKNYPSAPEAETAELQSADTWFRARKYAEAIGSYSGIISKYPKSKQLALAYLRPAQIYYNQKEDAKTVEQSKTVVSLFPGSPEAADAFDLMEAAFERDTALDFKAALGALSVREPKDRTSGEALFRLGRRLFEKKDYQGAVENLKKFSVDYISYPSIKDAQFYLGEAYFQAGDMQNSADVFERFVLNYQDSKQHPAALFRLGNAHYNLKKYRPASKAYAKLAELYPSSEYINPALFNLALCYKSMGSDRAEGTYRRYYDLAGASDDALSALWEIFNLQKTRGDLSGAVKTLTEIFTAASGKEDSLEALYHMGGLYSDNKQPDKARDCWERLVLQKPYASPWRLQGLVKLGEIYEGGKNYQQGAKVYEDIAKNSSTPEVAKAADERAKSLLEMGAGETAGKDIGEKSEDRSQKSDCFLTSDLRPLTSKLPQPLPAVGEQSGVTAADGATGQRPLEAASVTAAPAVKKKTLKQVKRKQPAKSAASPAVKKKTLKQVKRKPAATPSAAKAGQQVGSNW